MEGEIQDSLSGEQVAAIVQGGSAGVFESAGLSDASDIHAVTRVITHVFLTREGIHVTTHRVDPASNRACIPTLSTLEQHMLKAVIDARQGLGLVTRATQNPGSEREASEVWDVLGKHDESAG